MQWSSKRQQETYHAKDDPRADPRHQDNECAITPRANDVRKQLSSTFGVGSDDPHAVRHLFTGCPLWKVLRQPRSEISTGEFTPF
jgi:hypothetical protein